MVRYLPDGGARVVALLRELHDRSNVGSWPSQWTPVPPAFLDAAATAAGVEAQMSDEPDA